MGTDDILRRLGRLTGHPVARAVWRFLHGTGVAALVAVAGLAWGLADQFRTRVAPPESWTLDDPSDPASDPDRPDGSPDSRTGGIATGGQTAFLARRADADDGFGAGWPGHGGPQRDWISRETGLMPVWPPGGPRQLWRVAGGSGYSGLAVWRDRLVTMVGRKGEELVVCLDAGTGAELWTVRSDVEGRHEFGTGPQATPQIVPDRAAPRDVGRACVVSLGLGGELTCLRLADGAEVWRVNVRRQWGAAPMRYGYSCSPLVAEGMVLVNAGAVGASVVALDVRSGREVWRAGRERAGYSSPARVDVEGLPTAVFLTADGLLGVGLRDGRELWRHEWVTDDDCNVATPVWWPEGRVLFISTAHGKGAVAMRLTRERDPGGDRTKDGVRAEVAWQNRVMHNRISSCLRVGRHAYGIDGQHSGILKCIDLETGRAAWAARTLGLGAVIAAEGRLYVLNDKGAMGLFTADPSGSRELCRFQAMEGRCWTPPSIADGRLFVRNEREIACYDVRLPR